MKIKTRFDKEIDGLFQYNRMFSACFILFCAASLFNGTKGECQESIDAAASYTEITASWTNANATDEDEFEFRAALNGWYPDEDGPDPEKSDENYYISYTGNAIIHFGVTDQVRFPGTHSVMFHTDASIDMSAFDPFNSVNRTELHLDSPWRLPARAGEGNTVWIGWSEMWTDLDESNTTATLQLRNNGSNATVGYPAVELKILPSRVMQVRARYERTDLITVKENVWYDFILEMKYSKSDDGYIKVWIYEAGDSVDYQYDDAPAGELLNMPTMWDEDNRPHFRWGIYRWESCKKLPEEIPVEDHIVTKYIGPTRWKFGKDLYEAGFDAVKPRPVETNAVDETLDAHVLPSEFVLMQNYPNPFNPSTTISFNVARAGNVTLAIYNMQGQLVQTLFDGYLPVGEQSVRWDATDLNGNRVASGIYLYKMTSNDYIATRKLLLVN